MEFELKKKLKICQQFGACLVSDLLTNLDGYEAKSLGTFWSLPGGKSDTQGPPVAEKNMLL